MALREGTRGSGVPSAPALAMRKAHFRVSGLASEGVKTRAAFGSQLTFYLEKMNISVGWGSYMLTSPSPCLRLSLAS